MNISDNPDNTHIMCQKVGVASDILELDSCHCKSFPCYQTFKFIVAEYTMIEICMIDTLSPYFPICSYHIVIISNKSIKF